jgi:uncharacterized protein YkwD
MGAGLRQRAVRIPATAALVAICALLPPLAAADTSPQQALALMRSERVEGCAGHAGTRSPLQVNARLNAAAAQWAHGSPLQSAIARSGYREDQSAGLHVAGDSQALRMALSRRLCGSLTDAAFGDTGILQRGADIWIVLAAPFAAPAAASAGDIAEDVLRLVNAVRARPQTCGHTPFAPAAPLRLNALLTRAAQAHADDMLRFDYFEHTGHDGSTPAQRVTATGYTYRMVGENLASGPETAQEAVHGWLASPGHCQNLMEPHFSELGVAFAASRSGQPRIFWVQEFAEPR